MISAKQGPNGLLLNCIQAQMCVQIGAKRTDMSVQKSDKRTLNSVQINPIGLRIASKRPPNGVRLDDKRPPFGGSLSHERTQMCVQLGGSSKEMSFHQMVGIQGVNDFSKSNP